MGMLIFLIRRKITHSDNITENTKLAWDSICHTLAGVIPYFYGNIRCGAANGLQMLYIFVKFEERASRCFCEPIMHADACIRQKLYEFLLVCHWHRSTPDFNIMKL